jgi:two-component system cell cycle response regulator
MDPPFLRERVMIKRGKLSESPKHVMADPEEKTEVSFVPGFGELSDAITEKRSPLIDRTMPPAAMEGGAVPTEDAIMSARPICDRGTLTMVTGAEAGSVYRLGRSALVGRSIDCQIRVDEVGVSRRHALIVQESDTEYLLQDLGSRNGTSVRGKPVARSRLADGDRIGFGPVFFRFTLADEKEETALRLRYESSILDGLTGAMNRRHFDDRLIGEMAFAKRHDAQVSLLLLDIDHFKRVNDRYGHQAGDAVLRQLAATIRSALRLEDVFARYGGEEFAIIARGIDLPHAFAFGERLRGLVATTAFRHEQITIPITLSIGVAALADCHDASVDQLVALADARLYMAKAAGRNCCRGA